MTDMEKQIERLHAIQREALLNADAMDKGTPTPDHNHIAALWRAIASLASHQADHIERESANYWANME